MVKHKNLTLFKLIVMILMCIYMTSICFDAYAIEPNEENAESSTTTSIVTNNETVFKSDRDYKGAEQKPDDDTSTELFTYTNNNQVFMAIRESVAKWYYILYVICILIMLIALVVTAIKLAISNVAAEKASYKTAIVNWLEAMLYLFGIHFFMIVVLSLNDQALAVLRGVAEDMTDNSNSLYEMVRTRAYDVEIISGTIGMILYYALVFLTFKYIFVYCKRMINVIILTILAPVTILFYGMKSALDGKKSKQLLEKWMTDYVMNVIIQTIHALVYVLFMNIILKMIDVNIFGMIIALMVMNFMTEADKLFRKFLKFKDGSSLAEEVASQDMNALKGNVESAVRFGIAYNTSKIGKKLNMSMYAKPIIHIASKAQHVTDGLKDKFRDFANAEDGGLLNNAAKKVLDFNDGVKLKENYDNDLAEVNKLTSLMKAAEDKINRLKEEKKKIKNTCTQEEWDKINDEIRKEQAKLLKLENQKNKAETSRQKSVKKLRRYKTFSKVRHNLGEVVKADNYLEEYKDEKGRTRRRVLKKTKYFDYATGEFKTYGGLKEKFDLLKDDILGLSSDDKKALKPILDDIKYSVLGNAKLVAGLTTMVTAPTVGYGLLFASAMDKRKVRKYTRRKHYDDSMYQHKAFTTKTHYELFRKKETEQPIDFNREALEKFKDRIGSNFLGKIIDDIDGAMDQAEKDLKIGEVKDQNKLLKGIQNLQITALDDLISKMVTIEKTKTVEEIIEDNKVRNALAFTIHGQIHVFHTSYEDQFDAKQMAMASAILGTAWDEEKGIKNRRLTSLNFDDRKIQKRLLEKLKQVGYKCENETGLTAEDIEMAYNVRDLMNVINPNAISEFVYRNSVVEFAQQMDEKGLLDNVDFNDLLNSTNSRVLIQKIYAEHMGTDKSSRLVMKQIFDALISNNLANLENITAEEFKNSIKSTEIENNLVDISNTRDSDYDDLIRNGIKNSRSFLKTAILGTLSSHSIVNLATYDISNDEAILSEIISQLGLVGVDVTPENMKDIKSIISSYTKTLTDDELEEAFVKSKCNEYISNVLDGDVSNITKEQKADMSEYVAEALAERSKQESSQKEDDVDDVLRLLRGVNASTDENMIEESSISEDAISINRVYDDGVPRDWNIKVPFVKTKLKGKRLVCYFEIPRDLEPTQFKLMVKKYNGNNSSGFREVDSEYLDKTDEWLIAVLIENSTGNYGKDLVIKYPSSAVKLLNKMDRVVFNSTDPRNTERIAQSVLGNMDDKVTVDSKSMKDYKDYLELEVTGKTNNLLKAKDEFEDDVSEFDDHETVVENLTDLQLKTRDEIISNVDWDSLDDESKEKYNDCLSTAFEVMELYGLKKDVESEQQKIKYYKFPKEKNNSKKIKGKIKGDYLSYDMKKQIKDNI